MKPIRIEREEIVSLGIVEKLLPFRRQLATGFGTTHGNAQLELIDVLIVLLAAFYNPLVRSQRLIEALEQPGLDAAAHRLNADRPLHALRCPAAF